MSGHVRPGVRWCLYVNDVMGMAHVETLPYGLWLSLEMDSGEGVHVLVATGHMERQDSTQAAAEADAWMRRNGWSISKVEVVVSGVWTVHSRPST